MKKKFTESEKLVIVDEAIKTKDKTAVCVKYDIHYTTLYTWIRKFKTKKGRDNKLTFKMNDEEYDKLIVKCKALGYGNDLSSYVRKALFSKHIASGNPTDIIRELYTARGELNKVGSNLNQIANYTNFLMNQNYVEDGFIKDLKNVMNEFLKVSSSHRILIDKTIKKI